MQPEAVPGSAVGGTPEPSVPQAVLMKLLTRDELLTPQQHLQMFNSPLNISMDAGKRLRGVFTGSCPAGSLETLLRC